MPGLASLALAASMSSPLRPGDWFLAVTTMGHEPSLRLDDHEGSTAVVRGGSPDVGNWHEGDLEVGAKPSRLCPCSSDVNLFSYGECIIDFDAEIPDGALDLCVS